MPSKQTKPQIEEIITNVLNDDAKKNALDFVAFLRANKLSPRWASQNSWVVSYKNQRICYIRLSGTAHYHNLEDGSWHINHVNYGQTIFSKDDKNQYIPDEQLKNVVFNKIKFCTKCYNCKPGNSVMVLESQFNDVCHSWFVTKSPDIDAINCAKSLVIMKKHAITNTVKEEA